MALDAAVDENFGRWAAVMGEDRWYQSQRNTFEAGFRAGGAHAVRATGQLSGLCGVLRQLLAFLDDLP